MSLCENYRPVSLLCILSKIFEEVIYKHISNHLRNFYMLSPNQSGLLPNNSTLTQLLELQFQILNSKENNKNTCLIFLDISKAFDKVWHNGLLFKIKKCGISGKLLSWIENYLKFCMQRVCLNGTNSDWKEINC